MIRLKPRAPKINRRHPLARGLLAAYPFYEGGGGALHDVSGNGVNGTLTSGQPWAAGQFGSALSFNGSTQSVNLGSTLNPAAITYSAWVKPRTLTNAYQGIMGRSNNAFFSILLLKSSGKLAPYTDNANYDGTGSHTLTTGNWYHLVMVYSATAGVVGYVNGTVDGTAAANGVLSPTAVTFHIGNDPATASREFDGLIDNVLVYNRALSAVEVTQLYFDPFAIYRRSDYRVGVAAAAATIFWGYDPDPVFPERRRAQRMLLQEEPSWPGTVVASPAQFGWDNPEKFAIRRHFQPLQPDEPAEQWPLTATPVPGQFGWVNPEQFAKRQIVRGVSRQDADVTVTAPGTPTPTQQGFAWEPQFAIRRRFRTFQSPDDEFRFTATVTPTQFGWNVEPQFAKRPKARFNIYPGDEQWPFTAVKTPLPLGFSSDPQFPIRGRVRTLVRDDHEFVAFIDSSTGQIVSIRYIGPVWKRRRSLPAEQ